MGYSCCPPDYNAFPSWAEPGDQLWGQEQAGLCEWYLDYLSCVQLHNLFHAKFYRSHDPELQVCHFLCNAQCVFV